MTAFDRETRLPERPVDPDWLALREAADARSRDGAVGVLLAPLLARWGDQPDRLLRVVDLGAGTGANLRWLSPRLPPRARQQWTLVDHDPRLRPWGPVHPRVVQSTVLRADVSDLALVLAEIGGADLVTASALLDVLDLPALCAVVDAVAAARVPSLFTLTVTGEVSLNPADASDVPLAAAFDAHQRRDGRPGPDAGRLAAGLFRDRQWWVEQARTPWLLTSRDDADLLSAWLDGRAEAAVEQQPHLAPQAADWVARRRAEIAAGDLEAAVDHVDLLATPGWTEPDGS